MPLTAETSVIQVNVPTHFPVILTASNFLVWRKHVQSTLIGLDLLEYIDEALKIHKHTIHRSRAASSATIRINVITYLSILKVSLNGVRVGNGESKELFAGSEVSVVFGKNRVKSNSRFTPDKVLDISSNDTNCLSNVGPLKRDTDFRDSCIDLESKAELLCCNVNGRNLGQLVNVNVRVPLRECNSSEKPSDIVQVDEVLKPRKTGVCVPPPMRKFYLNRLHFMDDAQSGSDEVNVTLPELLYPVDMLERVFIATFMSDLSWFLSYCEILANLPIAVACHNAERCWSSSPDKKPYSDFPNLVVIYPQFPETISFGKERKKFGIACHYPKLPVLQRDDSSRVIITSANLVAKQPEEVNLNSISDFAAQFAGFMATLLVGAPEQAHWILELMKFDFSNAAGHLVVSVPGIYSPKHPYISESQHLLSGDCCTPRPLRRVLLGSVDASVVDSNGALLKWLAGVLGNISTNAYGLLEVNVRRNVYIAADANAVNIAVSESQESPGGGP
ncbi:forkhead-associated domain-containing protein / FHA domain-containing protein [Artemisia annua]|uniref:Forkhead-associated domain-containing protein / FHA domain-containing protein n=1 Tax=Artemisia annua TaxID=35608 RepID=A0A2U1P4E0_ARTAN|nr:forkhead-associated domain-containing protein / FHA domain-containing protein [Artemisia annua]